MTLFGPNDPNFEVASDDDAGEGFNAQINRNLSAGTYFLRVRLYSPNSTGNYAVGVRAVSATPGPGPGPVPIPELIVNGVGIDASISAANESDVYRFNVTTGDFYTIQTNGTTDTFMSLHGPNSQIPEIASNDDSGISFNALIRRQLSPGEYFVRVRHYSPSGTGAYSVRVTQG